MQSSLKYSNIPIFIPELACPHQCVFCDQKKIIGANLIPKPNEISKIVETNLSTMDDNRIIDKITPLDDDKLSKNFFKALEGGPSDGIKLSEEEIEKAKDMYFKMSGWDVESGNPTEEKLVALGIE